ncbi:Non-LTR retrotransposon R1Bmks ORF1 protein [Operophtera brumata]|uniref:Non-LTR retrotransposon R1Bmks ORF1 protein n=1 Tax=Operophtera brumata TaxID=104452 RepID=A0A0L7L349_OPEBR|nr:Non-LTR retrotransposon R1Bmks ORF1 protein [Operophtera brumata]
MSDLEDGEDGHFIGHTRCIRTPPRSVTPSGSTPGLKRPLPSPGETQPPPLPRKNLPHVGMPAMPVPNAQALGVPATPSSSLVGGTPAMPTTGPREEPYLSALSSLEILDGVHSAVKKIQLVVGGPSSKLNKADIGWVNGYTRDILGLFAALQLHSVQSEHRAELAEGKLSNLVESELQHILADPKCRPHFLSYAEKVFKIAARRNSTLPPPQRELMGSQDPNTPNIVVPQQSPSPNSMAISQLLACGEVGTAGIKIRGVALFMDDNNERLGLSFCFSPAGKTKRVAISPGLASLVNGSTSKTTMRYKTYSALPVIEVENHPCRLVRSKNKTIAQFSNWMVEHLSRGQV